MAISWTEAVEQAVRSHVEAGNSPEFSRQELIASKLDEIVAMTESAGKTPHMTLSRELQEMRDRGLLEFLDNDGNYRFLGS